MISSATDDNEERHRFRVFTVINSVAYVGICVHLALIPIFFLLNLPTLSLLNFFSTAMWVLAWYVNRLGYPSPAIALMTVEVLLHSAMIVPTLGWRAGFQYYLFPAAPFTLFSNKLDGKAIILVSVGLCVEFLILFNFLKDAPTPTVLAPFWLDVFAYANITIAFVAMCIISYYFRLASINLERELELQAHTDPLTGLYNRRMMLTYLDQQGRLAAFDRNTLSIAFVDIDFFKRFNDSYGHDVGDAILRAVAEFIKSHLRKGDTLARWGGEEFLLLLPSTDSKGASILAEKIRAAVAEHRFPIKDQNLSLTITIGVCQHHIEYPIEDCIKFADIALYRGKEAGRNCVICFN